MLRLRSFLVLVLLTAPGLGTAQDEGLLHLGYLTLAFPALWKFDFAQRPIVGHGPSGETVLITVRTRKDEEPADAARGVRDAVTDFVKGSMVEIATQHGMKLDRPIS